MKLSKLKHRSKISFIQFPVLLIYLSSCIEEPASTFNLDMEMELAQRMLCELEESGDYINSVFNPALIEAEEVYNNIDNYLIIDIRSAAEFGSGHIENSINILPNQLIAYTDSNQIVNYEKVVLVSSTGQHASYCASLFRLMKYDNVYSLNFGMAVWAEQFAKPWFDARDDKSRFFVPSEKTDEDLTYFRLPVQSSNSNISIDSFIKNRVTEILNYKFSIDVKKEFISDVNSNYYTLNKNFFSIFVNKKGDSLQILDTNQVMIVCYSNPNLYFNEGQSYLARSHPVGSLFFREFDGSNSSFRSSERLQLLPPNKNIFIYSYNGQRSAYATAYLQLFGYKAHSLSFGAINMMYERISSKAHFNEYIFKESMIKNYPVETN